MKSFSFVKLKFASKLSTQWEILAMPLKTLVINSIPDAFQNVLTWYRIPIEMLDKMLRISKQFLQRAALQVLY